MIELKSIKKYYKRGAETVQALRGIDLLISRGEFIAIVGPSGSGKTTMLHILGCLDKPTQGVMIMDNKEVENLPESELVKIRRDKIGFVFQQFYLIYRIEMVTVRDCFHLCLQINNFTRRFNNPASVFKFHNQ